MVSGLTRKPADRDRKRHARPRQGVDRQGQREVHGEEDEAVARSVAQAAAPVDRQRVHDRLQQEHRPRHRPVRDIVRRGGVESVL
eukprot:scaffold725_cov162-Ochromonas_danica.AAC.13